jgi:hypothetical protein
LVIIRPTLPPKLKNQEPAAEEGWGTRFIVVQAERWATRPGPFLTSQGFVDIGDGTTLWMLEDGTMITLPYQPQPLDVAVFQPTPEQVAAANAKGKIAAGHEQIRTDKEWVSDFKQPDFQPNRGNPNNNYVIYRLPD